MLAVAPDVSVPITAIWSGAVFTTWSPVPSMVMIGHGRELDELTGHVVEEVQAVADGDGEQAGAVRSVEHVGVRLAHDITRDRQPDHRRRQDLADVSLVEQLLDELDGRGLARLQPDDRAHA